MRMFVDVDAALEELGLDKEDFDEFVGELKSFTDEQIPQLEQVVKSRDFDEIRSQAHAVKGALANLRFVKSADYAKKLEYAGRESSEDGLDEAMAGLVSSLDESYKEMGL